MRALVPLMRHYLKQPTFMSTNKLISTTSAMVSVSLRTVNGAAARKAEPGHLLIIASYASYTELELEKFKPQLVYVDDQNRIINQRNDIPVQAA